MTTNHNKTGTSNPQDKLVYTPYDDEARLTGRMTTNHNKTGGANPQDKLVYVPYDDNAKPTIKETTLVNDLVANINNISNYSRDDKDIAKLTIRQQTENTEHIGGAKSSLNDGNYIIDNNYNAKITVKETTITPTPLGREFNSDMGNYVIDNNYNAKTTINETTLAPTPLGREFNSDMGNYTRDDKDTTRVTNKQTTIDTIYIGGIRSEIENKVSHEATDNIELDDRREISTFNRAANGKKDLHGPYINRDNVELNNPLLYSYVPIPHIAMDYSVMPSVSRDTIQKVYIRAKPVVQTSSYYINDCFINTLADNPLVNDIYHQKNINY